MSDELDDLVASLLERGTIARQEGTGTALGDALHFEKSADAITRLRRERDDALLFLDNAVARAPEPLQKLGEYLANLLDEDRWATAERYLNAAAKAYADQEQNKPETRISEQHPEGFGTDIQPKHISD